jgi:TRL-like protein family
MYGRCLALLVTMASLAFSGCMYSQVRVPLSSDFRNTKTVEKTGEATARSVLWLVAWGDAGLQKAAANGGLKTMEYADVEVLNICAGFYMSRTTIIYGN